jgi:hypothetical protein
MLNASGIGKGISKLKLPQDSTQDGENSKGEKMAANFSFSAQID